MMVDRQRLQDELRRVKRELNTDPLLRARYGLADGAPVTPELWERVLADVTARVQQEAVTGVPEPPLPAPPAPSDAAAPPELDDGWEARDAEARAKLFGESSLTPAPIVAAQEAGFGPRPRLFEESGDARWLGFGIALLASFVLPWAMGGGQVIFAWDTFGRSGWLAFFAVFAGLAGAGLIVAQLVPAVADKLDVEKRELIGGAIGIVGLLTCTGDLFMVGDQVGALLGRILLVSLFGLMVGLHARVHVQNERISRLILGISAGVLLLYYLFPQPLPGLPFGGASWQIPLVFLIRLFFASFDLPLTYMLLIGVPTLLMLVPFPAAVLGLWSAWSNDERLESYLELARRYVTFVIPAALVFMGAFTLFLPVTLSLLLWAGANVAVYLLLATEGVSRLVTRLTEPRG